MGLLGKAKEFKNQPPHEPNPPNLGETAGERELSLWKSYDETDFLAFIEPLKEQKPPLEEIPFLFKQVSSHFSFPPSLILVPTQSGGIFTSMGYHDLNQEEAKFFRMAITEDLLFYLNQKAPFLIEDEVLRQNRDFHHFRNPSAPSPAVGFPIDLQEGTKGMFLFFGLDSQVVKDELFLKDVEKLSNYFSNRLERLREQEQSRVTQIHEPGSLDAWAMGRLQKIKQIQKTPYLFALNMKSLLIYFGEMGQFLDPVIIKHLILKWMNLLIGEWGDMVLFQKDRLVFILPGTAHLASEMIKEQMVKSFHKEFVFVEKQFSPVILPLELEGDGAMTNIPWEKMSQI